ncbi:unnamed protein product [Meloidogyne enterolobii]|uniref:Uncharacterized protein n=1 Tax=Meloidogyne enterolobii TaxID=390850 RepID=A0ACB0XN40_MELEN
MRNLFFGKKNLKEIIFKEYINADKVSAKNIFVAANFCCSIVDLFVKIVGTYSNYYFVWIFGPFYDSLVQLFLVY